MGHDGSPTMGLNLWLLGSGISMYSDFCVFKSFLFFIFLFVSSDLLIFGS